MSLSVGIMGAGPSALVAAHAAKSFLGVGEVSLYSREAEVPATYEMQSPGPAKSKLFGAQYLHMPIPGIDCGTGTDLSVRFIGTAEEYRCKVYGEDYRGPVSPNNFRTDHRAWDIRAAYDDLWNRYCSDVSGAEFTRDNMDEVRKDLLDTHDVVICTIPRKALCANPEHSFTSQKVYAIGDAPELGIKNPIYTVPNTLTYNGSKDYGWYRTSNIFGHSTTEWPAREDSKKPPVRGVASVEKPLHTDCNCWPGIHFKGRYGEWKKGVLVHHVYFQVEMLVRHALSGVQGALF